MIQGKSRILDNRSRQDRNMIQLNHKQIFLDVFRLYFAPLVGAVRGAVREVAVVSKSIERRKRRQASTNLR